MSRAGDEESVRELLRRRGAPDRVVERGLAGLVEDWDRAAAEIESGYRLGLDDYLGDVDGRQLLDDAWGAAGDLERERVAARLGAADRRAQAALVPAGRCLWGEDVARYHGWDAGRHWWYFMRPRVAGAALEEELRARGF